MYVTIRRYEGSGELGEALVARQDEVRGVLVGIDGFRAYYIVGGDGDTTVTISIYETRDGAEESNRAAAAWVRENLPDLNVPAPTITAGEALLSF